MTTEISVMYGSEKVKSHPVHVDVVLKNNIYLSENSGHITFIVMVRITKVSDTHLESDK